MSMTRLVISVRDSEEATLAATGGADLIDLKEPLRGSMGRADAATLADVRSTLPTTRLSAAMGELAAPESTRFDWTALDGFQFAKAAPAGCSTLSRWLAAWDRWREHLPPTVHPVLVAYVDWQSARAPRVDQLVQAAERIDAVGVLLDTYDKTSGSLFTHCSVETIRGWARCIAAQRRWFALAGSLTTADIATALVCRPQFLAFRSAACEGGRRTELCPNRVYQIRDVLDGLQPSAGTYDRRESRVGHEKTPD